MTARTLTAVLVDDEEHCTDTLRWMLETYCPQVRVLAVHNDAEQALEQLRGTRADLLFLDVQMPRLTAFDLLRALDGAHGAVIFTTAHDEFAIQAIKQGALDYLLKPVDRDELIAAVRKAERDTADDAHARRSAQAIAQLRFPARTPRFPIPTREGFDLVPIDRMIHLQACDNYTEVHLIDGTRHVVSRTLKDVERELPAELFFRIHLSHVVALEHIARYVRGGGGYVVLSNGTQLPVAKARRDELLERIGTR